MKRFFDAIRHVEGNLWSPLDVHDVALAAGFSTYHFSRMFRVMVGESVMEYVRKRRLSLAAEKLRGGEVRILDLALECQFESHEAFTRAFKRLFQITPAEYRELREPSRVRLREAFGPETLSHLRQGVTMEPRIVDKPAIRAIGLLGTFRTETNAGIAELWMQFAPRMASVPARAGGHALGVIEMPDANEDRFDYLAAVEVSSLDVIPPGLVGRELPAARYAVFTHRCSPERFHETIQETMRYIFGTWLPGSGYEYGASRDFEWYDERFDPMTRRGEFDIYIPIKEAK